MKLSFEQLESALTGNLLYDISTSDIISREGNYFKIVQQQESIQSQNLVNIKNSKIEKLILFDEITNYLLTCLLYTSPSPRDGLLSRMPSSA